MYSLIQLKSGGQPGNQNARTHGFYSKVLTPDEKRALKRAAGVDGLDQEIAVLRVKIRTLLKNEGQNYRLIGQAFETLARVNNIKFGFSKNDGGKLKEAFRSTYGEYIFPQPSEAPAPNDSKPAVAPAAPPYANTFVIVRPLTTRSNLKSQPCRIVGLGSLASFSSFAAMPQRLDNW
jgi:hypothetical protein